MFSTLPLIFSLIFFASCGKHSQTSSGSQGLSDTQEVRTETLSADILSENLSGLESYLKAGGDLNAELSSGRTLLTEACYWVKFKVISFLVMNKASIDKKDRLGKSPEDYGMDDLKIKRALYPELVIELKKNLYLAVINNQLNDFKAALEENPPVNFSITQSELGTEVASVEGETLLTLCIRRKQENFLRLLAQPKWELDVNQKNVSGESPLYLAKSLGFKNIEKLLLKLGALE